MNIDDNLSKIFDLEPTEYKEIAPKKSDILVNENKAEYVDNDYEQARNNLYDLLETGKDALLDALEVAKQSENPRAFEVVGNLMKQLADMNSQLLELHQQKQKLSGVETKEKSNVTNNNAIFVGSTSELSKLIHDMNGESL